MVASALSDCPPAGAARRARQRAQDERDAAVMADMAAFLADLRARSGAKRVPSARCGIRCGFEGVAVSRGRATAASATVVRPPEARRNRRHPDAAASLVPPRMNARVWEHEAGEDCNADSPRAVAAGGGGAAVDDFAAAAGDAVLAGDQLEPRVSSGRLQYSNGDVYEASLGADWARAARASSSPCSWTAEQICLRGARARRLCAPAWN